MLKKINKTDVVPHLKSFKGLYKKKFLKNQNDFNKLCDYLEKIKWAIDDFNKEFLIKDQWTQKDIIFTTTLMSWIWDAANKIVELYHEDVISVFNNEIYTGVENAKQYFRAIRSFIVAHPLGTTQCSKYQLDGSWICVDIRTSRMMDYLAFDKKDRYHLDINGLKHQFCDQDDIILYTYSNRQDEFGKSNNFAYYRKIGMSSNDLVWFVNIALIKINKLNTYLSKL